MENWLKCNRCYRSVKNSTKEFYVTQCQHVFCNNCVVEARKQCAECKAVGSQTIPLKNAPPQISHYFSPVSELVDRTLEAARFQKSQFMIFIRRSRQIDEKYEKLKKTNAQALEYMKHLKATFAKLTEDLEKLRVTDVRGAHSVTVNSNFTRSSINPAEEQRRTIRESRNVPEMTNSQYAQQKKLTNNQEHHIKRTLGCGQSSARSRSNARGVPQHRMITEARNIPEPSIIAYSRSSTHHRDSQNLMPTTVYQSQTNTQMMNIRYDPNLQFGESHYQPRSIMSSSARSRLERTPQEEIRRVSINRRIPRSMETMSPMSSSDCNTPNDAAHSSNYHCWNIPSR